MALTWPIATPHRLAKLRAGNSYPSIHYDAEEGTIEWTGIPLKLRKKDDDLNRYIFTSDWIRLDIREPVEIYQQLELSGRVEIEIDGLLSGLDLDYVSPIGTGGVTPIFRTILVDEFTLNLEEGLGSKEFSPRQHLYFPGIVLDEMRIADVLMLLEDKGFELELNEWRALSTETVPEELSEKKQYIIKAIRNEGVKEITVLMAMRGTNANTTRERKTLGKAKYTTPLPTGDTSIYIRRQMAADSKRIVKVVNEIQKQLKEQFRHVGSTK